MINDLLPRTTGPQSAAILSNDLLLSSQIGNQLKQELGIEKVSLCSTCHELFSLETNDFLILDKNSGEQIRSTVRRCRDRFPRCSIIVCCQPAVAVGLEDCLALTNVEFVHKPFCPEELELRLRKLKYQQRTVTELEDSLRFIRQVSDLNPELIYLFDVESSLTIYVNQSLCELVGCTPLGIEPEGLVYLGSVMKPDECERVSMNLPLQMKGISRGEFVTNEYEIRNAEQTWRLIRVRETAFELDEKGTPKQILGVAQDITDTQRLIEMTSWLAAIVDSSDEAIIGKSLDGKVVSWNVSAELLYGYRADEICGKNIAVLLPPDEPDDLPELMEKILNRERTERFRTRRQRKDGTVIDVSLNESPVIDRENNLIGVSTVAHRLS